MSYVGEAEGEISPMSRKKMYYGCTTILLPFYIGFPIILL